MGGEMANIEVHQDTHSVYQVSKRQQTTSSNYSHFNMYKHLQPGELDGPEASTVHRQARVDQLAAPRNRTDIANILSDTHDKELPIFRVMTLATLVLNGSTGH